MVSAPVVVVAGTESGVGKTSIAVGLVAAFRRRGLRVQPFKVGPDFLDPTYLERAAGRPCFNLDGWMMGNDGVLSSFARHSEGADLSIIEGVMGLFDGADPCGPSGSTAEVALWLGAPVVLVVNAQGMSRSLAALVKGFAEFDPSLDLVGVVLNQIGSPRHATGIAEALAHSGLPRVVGAVPAGSLATMPSRHLGLVTADPATFPETSIACLADAMESHVDLSSILALAQAHRLPKSRPHHRPKPQPPEESTRAAAALPTRPPAPANDGRRPPSPPALRPLRIAIARDRAFHFYYHDNLEALREHGAQLIEFSPLADPGLPEPIDLLYLGGGYPEIYAAELSANRPMCEAVRRHVAADRPTYAECGGLLFLGESLDLVDGTSFPMVGALPVRARMRERIAALGYVEAEGFSPSLLGPVGTRVRGHEFHYSEIHGPKGELSAPWSAAYRIQHRHSEQRPLEGYCRGNVLASYVHVHFATRPEVVDHIVERCFQSRAQSERRSG